MPHLKQLVEAYAEALREYLEHGGEAPLYKAYQIGRDALSSGMGALEVATAHQEALVLDLLELLTPEEGARTARRASEFFAEALAPFEANRLGFQEAAGVLRELNGELERRVRAALDAYQAASVQLDEQRRMEALKDEFVSLVSHELRTPLTSIHGALGIIGAKYQAQLPDEAARLLEVARRNSERLKRLIDGVLDLQKAEAGFLTFEIRPLELAPLLQQTIDANQPYAAQLGVRLALRDAPPGLHLSADPDRVAQVLTNLISNAVKFSPAGGEVLVFAEQRGGHLVVAVADHGPGVPESFRDRVFQRFAQADASSTRRSGGTGLGLSISKAIVERMQGRIGFKETPGGGATFYFELPAEVQREEGTWLGPH
jgi:signal transduction histidine kinase